MMRWLPILLAGATAQDSYVDYDQSIVDHDPRNLARFYCDSTAATPQKCLDLVECTPANLDCTTKGLHRCICGSVPVYNQNGDPMVTCDSTKTSPPQMCADGTICSSKYLDCSASPLRCICGSSPIQGAGHPPFPNVMDRLSRKYCDSYAPQDTCKDGTKCSPDLLDCVTKGPRQCICGSSPIDGMLVVGNMMPETKGKLTLPSTSTILLPGGGEEQLVRVALPQEAGMVFIEEFMETVPDVSALAPAGTRTFMGSTPSQPSFSGSGLAGAGMINAVREAMSQGALAAPAGTRAFMGSTPSQPSFSGSGLAPSAPRYCNSAHGQRCKDGTPCSSQYLDCKTKGPDRCICPSMTPNAAGAGMINAVREAMPQGAPLAFDTSRYCDSTKRFQKCADGTTCSPEHLDCKTMGPHRCICPRYPPRTDVVDMLLLEDKFPAMQQPFESPSTLWKPNLRGAKYCDSTNENPQFCKDGTPCSKHHLDCETKGPRRCICSYGQTQELSLESPQQKQERQQREGVGMPGIRSSRDGMTWPLTTERDPMSKAQVPLRFQSQGDQARGRSVVNDARKQDAVEGFEISEFSGEKFVRGGKSMPNMPLQQNQDLNQQQQQQMQWPQQQIQWPQQRRQQQQVQIEDPFNLGDKSMASMPLQRNQDRQQQQMQWPQLAQQQQRREQQQQQQIQIEDPFNLGEKSMPSMLLQRNQDMQQQQQVDPFNLGDTVLPSMPRQQVQASQQMTDPFDLGDRGLPSMAQRGRVGTPMGGGQQQVGGSSALPDFPDPRTGLRSIESLGGQGGGDDRSGGLPSLSQVGGRTGMPGAMTTDPFNLGDGGAPSIGNLGGDFKPSVRSLGRGSGMPKAMTNDPFNLGDSGVPSIEGFGGNMPGRISAGNPFGLNSQTLDAQRLPNIVGQSKGIDDFRRSTPFPLSSSVGQSKGIDDFRRSTQFPLASSEDPRLGTPAVTLPGEASMPGVSGSMTVPGMDGVQLPEMSNSLPGNGAAFNLPGGR